MIAPMPKHGHGVNAMDDYLFVTSMEEISTPLMKVKKNSLLVVLFPGCGEGCHICSILPAGYHLLKSGVRRLIDNIEILFEKTLITLVPIQDVAIITISANPSKVSSRKPVRITPVPRIAPLIITVPGPIPYTSDKDVPWHYGADVYYHGVKQDLKSEEVDVDVSNIVGASKVTRRRRLFSPEISPPIVHKPVVIPSAITSTTIPVHIPVITPVAESSTRGKEIIGEPARMEAPKKIIVETSK